MVTASRGTYGQLSHSVFAKLSSFARASALPSLDIKSYHSEHHPDPPPFPPVQTAILSAALERVPEYGFSEQALSLGAKDANYLEISVQLFPRGVYDLINYYLVTQRIALKDRVQFAGDSKLGVGKKVRILTLERLRANKDIIHQWQGVRSLSLLYWHRRHLNNSSQALGYMSLLANIPASLRELNALSDEIWYLAGDTSVDTSWYTKRASLAAIYSSSEVFMTTDTTKDFKDTEEFVDRRLQDVQKVGGTLGGGLSQFAGFWASNSVNLARSLGVRI